MIVSRKRVFRRASRSETVTYLKLASSKFYFGIMARIKFGVYENALYLYNGIGDLMAIAKQKWSENSFAFNSHGPLQSLDTVRTGPDRSQC